MKKDVTWILAASHSTESGRLGTYSSLTGASDSPAPHVCRTMVPGPCVLLLI